MTMSQQHELLTDPGRACVTASATLGDMLRTSFTDRAQEDCQAAGRAMTQKCLQNPEKDSKLGNIIGYRFPETSPVGFPKAEPRLC